MNFDAAIFDLDGTLADSMHVWTTLFPRWLSLNSLAPDTALFRKIGLLPLSGAAELVINHYRLNLSPASLCAQWEEMVLAEYAETLPLKPGTREFVLRLHAHGCKIAVATSCFRAAAEAFLSRHDLLKVMDALVFTEEIGLTKSEPEIYLAAAKQLCVHPSRCIVFEDIAGALPGVRAAGMTFVAVEDRWSPQDHIILRQQADFYLTCFTNIEPLNIFLGFHNNQ